ncbi:MAG: efflux RND transporter periplasmic adaptor subunit, partial [Pseudomonadota bacterium]
MPKLNSTLSTFLISLTLTGAILLASFFDRLPTRAYLASNLAVAEAFAQETQDGAEQKAPRWAASATGRIEPASGTVRVVSQLSGLVLEVAAETNDTLKEGDLLLRLDDEDYLTRIAIAKAEEQVRRSERNEEPATGLAKERQEAEDAVFDAKQERYDAWQAFDEVSAAARQQGQVNTSEMQQARDQIKSITAKLTSLEGELLEVNGKDGMPLPNRLESSLTIARSELALAQNAFERTRIRAPFDGTVLNVFAKTGETVGAGGPGALVSFGDLDSLKVRAEVEERDVAKVKVGQKVVVRADAFPDREFTGVVAEVASALGSPRITSRGPRRPNDVDVLEVVADLDGTPPLLTGMRVDVFFEPTGASRRTAAAT